MKHLKWIAGMVLIAAMACIQSAHAQGAKRDAKAEMDAALEAARTVAKSGPVSVPLKDQAMLQLPSGYVFIPQPQADQLMKAMGNGVDPTRIGVIFPKGDDGQWMVVARFINAGYVKDDEARDWKSDEMLQQIKEGTEESNKERADMGLPQMEVVGWAQPPKYDAQTHRLMWSIESKDKGGPSEGGNGINYNTFVLGREGYISLNLITSMQSIEKDKPVAADLLSSTSFNSGKKYSDFNSSTDRVAEYGIAALVAGVAAKKLGLIALIAAFAAKSIKLIGVALLAAGAGIGKFFKRKKAEDTPADGGTGAA